MTETADRKAVVQLSGIRKQFPGVLANDDISLDIQEGEIFAILGENGAGKTTLMNILFGLYRPDAGEIRIRGDLADFSSPRDATALGIGMVHQHFKLVENYTVAENIILGLEPVRKRLGLFPLINEKFANREIAELSDHYGLKVDPRLRIKDASVSEQQRVEILKMLYRKADILILDEPTAMLAPQEIEHLIQVIHELRRNGKTVILITHKLDEIQRLADRCAVLRRGRLIDIFDVKTTDTAHMAETMVGHAVDYDLKREKREPGEPIQAKVSLLSKMSLSASGLEKYWPWPVSRETGRSRSLKPSTASARPPPAPSDCATGRSRETASGSGLEEGSPTYRRTARGPAWSSI